METIASPFFGKKPVHNEKLALYDIYMEREPCPACKRRAYVYRILVDVESEYEGLLTPTENRAKNAN